MLTVAAAAVAALVSVWLFAAAGADGGDFSLRLSVSPSLGGGVTVNAAPLGTLSADSFVAPAHLVVDVGDLAPKVVSATVNEALAGATPSVLERDASDLFSEGVSRGLTRLLVVSLLLGALGGAAAGLLLRRHPRDTALGAGVGLVTIGLLAGLAWFTHDPSAYRSPTATGAFAAQPVTGDPRPGTLPDPDVGSYLGKLQRNLAGLYRGFLLPVESAAARQGASRVVVAVAGTSDDLTRAVAATSEAEYVVWLDGGPFVAGESAGPGADGTVAAGPPAAPPSQLGNVTLITYDGIPAPVGSARLSRHPTGAVTMAGPGAASLAISAEPRTFPIPEDSPVLVLPPVEPQSDDGTDRSDTVVVLYLDPESGALRAYDEVSATESDIEVVRRNLAGLR